MNDTQTHDTPLHITMEASDADAIHDLLQTPDDTIRKYLHRIVETKFNELLQNTKALSLMDEGLRVCITEMIDDRIGEHEMEKDHYNEEDIITMAADEVRDQINTQDVMTKRNMQVYMNDYLNEELDGLVDTAVDNVIDDKIEAILNDKLESATISISL